MTDLVGTEPRQAPTITVRDEDNVLQINLDGDVSRLAGETYSKPVVLSLIGQIAALGSEGKRVDEIAANFVLGFVDSMKPRDAAEALLLTQMATTHQAAMMIARKFNHTSNLYQQDAGERALNKLLRSYAAQMETLKKYRSKGQQTVRVERVTVEPGGQAVVGNVQHGGGAAMAEKVGNPMQSAHNAPRCTAKSKRSGQPCQAPAVRGWKVCRMHGARGGSKHGPENPAYKHGERTQKAAELRRMITRLGREARAAMAAVERSETVFEF